MTLNPFPSHFLTMSLRDQRVAGVVRETPIPEPHPAWMAAGQAREVLVKAVIAIASNRSLPTPRAAD